LSTHLNHRCTEFTSAGLCSLSRQLKRRGGNATRLGGWRIVQPDWPCCPNIERRCQLPNCL
jgi:hypothetical protein